MNIFWKMPAGLRIYFVHELAEHRRALKQGNFQSAWRWLERAHIMGQPWAVEHTYVHWLMLRFGIRMKNKREILGQLPRLLAGGVKSFVGKIPVGNTGGAGVPPLQRMEIPYDIQEIMRPYFSR